MKMNELEEAVDKEVQGVVLEGVDVDVDEDDIEEWKATASLCKSSKPDSALGASALASCKSQGYRARKGGKSHKVGKKRVKVGGKKLKGKKYGGNLPDYS